MTAVGPFRRIEALVFRYPIAQPIRTSFGIMHDRPAVFIRAEDRDGAVGWGEAWCNFPSVGAEHRARLVNELLAPMVLDRNYQSPAEAFTDLTKRTAVLALQSGEPGPIAQAIAGIDIALWDLAGRRADKPLWQLLGGCNNRVAVYASGINPTGPERIVLNMQSRGHRAFKLKIGFGDAVDERNLTAIRDAIGADPALAVDANQAWDIARAVHMAARMERYHVQWLEEPLRADRPWSEWQSLAQTTSVPLAAGENMAGIDAFRDAIAQDVFEVMQPDVAKWGGISGCFDAAKEMIAAGITYCPHYLGGGVGLLASAHLLAAVGGDGMLEIDANENPLRDDVCGRACNVSEGHIVLPDGAGLGCNPDVFQLSRYRVREQRVV